MSEEDFAGFELPNTTPVPDIVFDELLGKLTGNELKVLLYIIRRTYGFGKNADAISLSQFRRGIKTKDEKVLDKGCGIDHNRTIIVSLNSLEEKGYITSKKRKTKIGDSDTTVYKLQFKNTNKTASREASSGGVVTPGNDGSLPQVTTVVTQGNDGSYLESRRVVTPGNPQETVLQQTDKQEDTYVATANADRNDTPLSLEDKIADLQQQLETLRMQSQEQASSELSTPTEEISSERVDNSGQNVNDMSELPQASDQSYSQPTTPSEKPARAPRTRKPKVAKAEGPTPEQIEKVYTVFDELFRSTLTTPDPDFSCTRTKGATEAIKELIHCKASPARLKAVFLSMWNEKDDRTGEYWWRKRGRLSIKSVCNHYASRVISVENPQTNGKKSSSVQQQVEDNASGFNTKTRDELMDMSAEDRKEYNKQYRAFVSMKEAVEQQQQATGQKVSQAS